ncbi:L-rhamnose mutarotase [Cohnella silvisoli]|uniref:L-rhamnose mutarotase n=1 Tax=Cohnella silvisoli TaxID=2873699 RepID=A0ABV1KVH9_9BACL|nr:L-rhamnose mutarotase [Cohnella silvisoli]MCD9023512.1 L-rhamnose mutarotase [Cohnella silvisoli]
MEARITEIKVAHLHPDQVERYEQLHRDIPAMNEKHMREAGIVSLRIFREGLTLFMIVESDPSQALPERVIDHHLEEEWHRLTGVCFSEIWQDACEIYRLQGGNLIG